MITGITPDTFLNIQLGTGIFLCDFDFLQANDSDDLMELIADEITRGENCLGATGDSGSFLAVPKIRRLRADGLFAPDSILIDGWNISLKTSIKEITKMNLSKVITSHLLDPDTGCIKIKNKLTRGDYIKNLIWVGSRLDGSLLLIKIHNALNLAGLNLSFSDKNETSVPVEFVACHYNYSDTAPCEIFFL